MSETTQGRPCLPVRLAWASLVTGLLLWHPATANADDPEQAEQLLKEGIALFSDGEFARSRGVLQQAMERSKQPELLGRIQLYMGLNHASENHLAAARNAFRAALSHDPRLRIDPRRYKKDYVRLFEQAQRSMEGELEVTADPPGAEVMLDGELAGTAPYRGRTFQGEHKLEVRSAARLAQVRQVSVTAGQITRVAITLSVRQDDQDPRPLDASGGRTRHRLWTWIAAGSAVASAAVAIGLGLSASADHGEACDLLAGPTIPCEERTQLTRPEDRERYEELRDSMSSKKLATNIAWGTSGALAVTAVVLYFLEGRADSATEERTVRLLPQLGPVAGARLRLIF